MNTVLYGDVTLMQVTFFLGIVIASLIFSRLIISLIRRNFNDRLDQDQFQLINKLVFYGVVGSGTIAAIPLLGIKLSGLVVAGGVAGMVIGFASQNLVSNLISGILIMVERPFKIGHTMQLGTTLGIVEDIRIMSTIIRTFDGLYIRIPNIQVFTGSLSNFSFNVARRIEYSVGIRYSDDATKAVSLIRDLLDKNPLVLINPEAQVFVNDLGNDAVLLSVRFWAPTPDWFELKTTMLQKIRAELETNGIQIPFPQRVIWNGDTNSQERPVRNP